LLYFLHPIAFYTAAAIGLPIAIHLWNAGSGKTLQVGSIRLFIEGPRKRWRRFLPSEWWLLLLRCFLLIILAALMAGPAWREKNNGAPGKPWILMGRESFGATYRQYATIIDSMVKTGAELHLLAKGFPAISPGDSTALELHTDIDTLPYRALAAQWLRREKVDAYIFTTDRLRHFAGPALPSGRLHWFLSGSPDSVNISIVGAHPGPPNGSTIEVLQRENGSHGTRFIRQAMGDSHYEQKDSAGSWWLRYQKQSPVKIDTAACGIVIYAGDHVKELKYLSAALEAIKSGIFLRVRVTIVKRPAEIEGQPQWLFWLSDEAIPEHVHAANLFVFAHDKTLSENSWLEKTGERNAAIESIPIQLYMPAPQAVLPVWQDGFGHIILGVERNKRVFHLYTRLDPDWNGLSWNGYFPVLLSRLLFEYPFTGIAGNDLRRIDPLQVMPATGMQDEKAIATGNSTDLFFITWLLFVVVLIAERICSLQSKRQHAG